MHLYEEIISNEEYRKTMREIDSIHFITDGKWDWEHGLEHAIRVSSYVESILKQLGQGERVIELGKVAALLHDVGLTKGDKIDHAKISSQQFIHYIQSLSLREEEIEIIRQAIFDHSKGEEMKSLIGVSLLLADKLDVTYHRVLHSTIQDQINKEFGKIRKVSIEITDQNLVVSYQTEVSFDIEVLKNWKKTIAVPQKVASYLGRNFIFKVNEKEVNISNLLETFDKEKRREVFS